MKTLSLLAFLFLSDASLCTYAITLHLSTEQAREIGKKIWHNECGGTITGLTHWGQGEDFPSLGIGHFIWCTPNSCGVFAETFPALRTFLAKRGKQLPGQFQKNCPWHTREQFLAAVDSRDMKLLRSFLAETIDLQVQFILQRFKKALPVMLKYAPAGRRGHIKGQFLRVAHSPMGLYPLIDYVNFKGEGIKPSEQYSGKGWGLLQVLDGMKGANSDSEALQEFSKSAQAVLLNRIKYAPAQRNEARWWPGWKRRLLGYIT